MIKAGPEAESERLSYIYSVRYTITTRFVHRMHMLSTACVPSYRCMQAITLSYADPNTGYCPCTTEFLPAYDIWQNKPAWSWSQARLFSLLTGSNHDNGHVVRLSSWSYLKPSDWHNNGEMAYALSGLYRSLVYRIFSNKNPGFLFFSVPHFPVLLMETVPLLETVLLLFIISGRQFDIFRYISAHQMPRNVHCTHHTVGICRHMNACHAPCILYNMCTSFYTGASTCGHNLIEACATIGDWAFIFFRTF